MIRTIVTAGIALLLTACGGSLKTDYQAARDRAAAYLAAHPDLDPETKTAISRQELRPGMSMEQVVAAWGAPRVVQRFRDGAVQYWFFGCDTRHLCASAEEMFPPPDAIYLDRALFENGRLVSWQG